MPKPEDAPVMNQVWVMICSLSFWIAVERHGGNMPPIAVNDKTVQIACIMRYSA